MSGMTLQSINHFKDSMNKLILTLTCSCNSSRDMIIDMNFDAVTCPYFFVMNLSERISTFRSEVLMGRYDVALPLGKAVLQQLQMFVMH